MLPPALAEIVGEAVSCRGRVALDVSASLDFYTGVVSELFFALSAHPGNHPSADMRFTVRLTIYLDERQVN
jgi:hypothetical protein